jgi:8-oxo-dGTP diphosphatase
MTKPMFTAVVNPYQGCYIGPEQLLPLLHSADSGLAAFQQQLAASIEAWQKLYQLIWLDIPPAAAGFIPAALAAGFEYHHGQGQQLMLVKKLRPDAYLPLAATHSIGVGGLVWSGDPQRRGQVLMVQEQPLPGQTPGYFKLPGGMVEPKENFAIALQREVFEETGVRAKLSGMLGLRHHHQGQFGASNVYLIGVLFASSAHSLPEVWPQVGEIAQARWFEPDAYLSDEKAHPYNKLILRRALSAPLWSAAEIAEYRTRHHDYEIFIGEGA